MLNRGIEEELDLCDTRTSDRITFRKQLITDMLLDFGFLEELWQSEFAGRVYISEYIDALYSPRSTKCSGQRARRRVRPHPACVNKAG